MLALEWFHGPHEIAGTYQHSRDGALASAPAQPRCTLVGVAYRYRFSLRSFLMAQYAYVDNKVGRLCNFATSPLEITANQDLRGAGIGMRTDF
jgi:predicted porin